MKININKLRSMKRKGIPVAWITAYDLPFAWAAEQAEIDMILVGDSGGMVQLGYQTTNPVTMDEMITLAKSARRGAPDTFIIGDMPQGSYEIGDKEAIYNALRFIKEAGCDAVKLEGGARVASRIRAIADSGVLVMGHLGLTPQSSASFGGYRVQGKTIRSFEETYEDAVELQKAGAFAILIEAMPSEPAGQIAKQLEIPIYSIGGGQLADGQLVIMHDLMGFYQPFRPWFAKCYVPDVLDQYYDYIKGITDLRKIGREQREDGLLVLAQMVIKKYINDVREKRFPSEEYSYQIEDKYLEKLRSSKYWQE